MACSTSGRVSPLRRASSAPIFGWPPSISWSAALPTSWSRPQRRASLPSSPNSPALAADDAPLHVVAGDVHRADGRVGGVVGSVAVDRHRDDASRLLLGRSLDVLLVPRQADSDLFRQFALQPFQQDRLRLVAAQP